MHELHLYKISLNNIGACVLLSASFLLSVIFFRIFLHPLRGVPGPFIARITEIWRTYRYYNYDWHKDILDLHRRYGPVVRVSPNEVSIVSRKGLVEVYGHGKGTLKTSWYDVWDISGMNPSFFFVQNPRQHSFLRKRVAGVYSMTALLSLEKNIESISQSLWTKLDQFAQTGRHINLHTWATYFAFDVVGKVALGQPIGFIEESRDVMGLISSIHTGFRLMSIFGYIPGQMFWFNNPVMRGLGRLINGTYVSPYDHFTEWSLQQINNRIQNPGDKDRSPDMLDHFISMKEPDGSSATIESVLGEVGNIIGAGADTTSIGIAAVIAQLISHKDHYYRVRDEVDKAYQDHGPLNESEELPFKVLEKLPYLGACIKEALRLHPSILWQLPREAPKQGIDISGYYIPPSATISMSPLAQNRDKDTFGPDANNFNPTRWTVGNGNSEAKIRDMDKHLATFGYGGRVCAGRNLAMIEITKFVAEFTRRYEADYVNKEQPLRLKSQWFSYQSDMLVRLVPRKK
ncbi:cytochrome P450 [Corynespora cassiicola Philippines]|uniref:Cytochrome P450 n=1 Tax=Corynespora cassiicola Philippines TaxID=1448308 RepID=A0A2T2NFH6_CORCC|nr:cytochrome P450 [Corynespora cassiicola Philippines]